MVQKWPLIVRLIDHNRNVRFIDRDTCSAGVLTGENISTYVVFVRQSLPPDSSAIKLSAIKQTIFTV